MQPIAFVGLGAMGRPMARRLIQAGHAVRGYDLNPSALEWLAGEGGDACASAVEAAVGAKTLVLMVVSIDQAEAVLFAEGAAEAIGRGGLVLLMATCPPDRVRRLGEALGERGLDLLDAPVSGGVRGAEAATLTIMAAGPDPAFAAAEPLLRLFGDKVHHVGRVWGQGAVVKTVNQLLCGVHIAAAAEALALAEKAGIEGRVFLDILGGSAASSWMLRDRGPRMVADTPEVTSAVDIFVKDLGIVLDAGRAAKAALPLAAAAHQMFLAASGRGLGAEDDSQVVEVYRALAGIGKA